MVEAFGLDRKIAKYAGTRPITLYRWDIECIMDVIWLALRDKRAHPLVTRFVQTQGGIEIGDQEGVGFVVRALGYGGMVFESTKVQTLAEAMTVLEKGIVKFLKIRSEAYFHSFPSRNMAVFSPHWKISGRHQLL